MMKKTDLATLAFLKTEKHVAIEDINTRNALHWIGLHLLTGHTITVLQAMTMMGGKGGGSMSVTTAHRRLKFLKTQGYIELQVNEEDQRIKQIFLTLKATVYFQGLGKSLIAKQAISA